MKTKNTGIHTIYVGNLNYNTDENHLLGLFKEYGYIKNIKILREGKENKSKGIAFIDMVNLDEAKKAIDEVNGKEFFGRTLKASLANTQNFKENPNRFQKEQDQEKPIRKIETKEEIELAKKREVKFHKERKEKRKIKSKGLQELFSRTKK